MAIHKANVTSNVLKKCTFSGSNACYLRSFSSKFFSFGLDARISEAFSETFPNPLTNYSIRAYRIPYDYYTERTESCSISKSASLLSLYSQHNPHLQERVVKLKQAMGFQLIEPQDVLLMVEQDTLFSIYIFPSILPEVFTKRKKQSVNSLCNDLFALAKPWVYRMATYHVFPWSTSVNSRHTAYTPCKGRRICARYFRYFTIAHPLFYYCRICLLDKSDDVVL